MTSRILKFIPKDIESSNRFLAWHKKGRYKYANYRDSWYSVLNLFFRKIERSKTRIEASIYRIMGKGARHFDLANMIGGTKPIPDFLKRAGWIWDDSDKWFECEYFQLTIREAQEKIYSEIWQPGTIIIIKNIENFDKR